MTKEDVIGWLEFLSEQEHVKADGIVPCDTEIALGMAIEALKQPEIVRRKDCRHLFDAEHNDNCCDVLMEKAEWGVEITVDPDWFCAYADRR